MKKKLIKAAFVLSTCAFIISAAMVLNIYLEDLRGQNIYDEAEVGFVSPAPIAEPGKNEEPKGESQPPYEEPPPDPEAGPSLPPIEPAIVVDFDKLKAVNPDIIGWIYIPNTSVSFPILKGADNDQYLRTTYNKKSSKFGSIFIDVINDKDFSDRQTIIYGHNIKRGAMFGDLSSYGKQSYFEQHPNIYILTATGHIKYDVVSAHVTNTEDGIFARNFADKAGFKELVSLINRSSYIKSERKATTKDKIITLSTCVATNKKEERFVVHAVLSEDNR